MDDPRQIPPRAPGESDGAYCRRLNAMPLRCAGGCRHPIVVDPRRLAHLPGYCRRCYGRTAAFRARASERAKARWQRPAYRAAQSQHTSLRDPAIRALAQAASARAVSNPSYRRSRMKTTVSGELLARHPEQADWITQHAPAIDGDFAIYPESYLDHEQRWNTLEYLEEPPDEPDASGWAYAVAFCDLSGRKVETLAECR